MQSIPKFDPWAHIKKSAPGAATAATVATDGRNRAGTGGGVAIVATVAGPALENENFGRQRLVAASGSAAMVLKHNGLPPDWIAGFAALSRAICPEGVQPARWQQVIEDAGRFLDAWGSQAVALDWRTLDLFGCEPNPSAKRLDRNGLVFQLSGRPVVALTKDSASIRCKSGNILRHYRRDRPSAVLLWEISNPLNPHTTQTVKEI